MNILSSFTKSVDLNLHSNYLTTQVPNHKQNEIRIERLIGVAPPLLSTVEDRSDNLYEI